MKLIPILTFCTLVNLSSFWAQKTTYYLVGRPFTIERNNAMQTVGGEWDICFQYLTQKEIDAKGLEKVAAYTDSVFKKIAKSSAFKENWYNEFIRQATEEEHTQNEIRLKVAREEQFKALTKGKTEVVILLEKEKKRFKKYYLVYIVTQIPEAKGFEVVGKVEYRIKKKKLSWKKVSSACLPFELIQNALTDPC